MPARNRRTLENISTFSVTLTGVDLVRWHHIAKQRGLSLEQLVKLAVESLIAVDGVAERLGGKLRGPNRTE